MREQTMDQAPGRLRPFLVWTVGALGAALLATLLLHAAFPLLTVVWLGVPLIVVLSCRDARRVGFRPVPWPQVVATSAAALAMELVLLGLIEPWAGVYRTLLAHTLHSSPPDTTFGWLARYPGAGGWLGLVLYSGLVSLFGEELCFRGWLLQLLLPHLGRRPAIALQAAIFTLPQLIVVFIFVPWQAALWVLVYSWLAIGVVGGWAAARTASIWPSLIAATVTNLVLTAVVV